MFAPPWVGYNREALTGAERPDAIDGEAVDLDAENTDLRATA